MSPAFSPVFGKNGNLVPFEAEAKDIGEALSAYEIGVNDVDLATMDDFMNAEVLYSLYASGKVHPLSRMMFGRVFRAVYGFIAEGVNPYTTRRVGGERIGGFRYVRGPGSVKLVWGRPRKQS